MADRDYSPAEVTRALTILAEAGGNSTTGAQRSNVPKSTLEQWKRDTHAEQYRSIELRVADEVENVTIQMARANAKFAGEVEALAIRKLKKQIESGKDVDKALRALADSKSKNIAKVMDLTGRTPSEGSSDDLMQLLKGMEAKGYLRMNVNVDVAAPEVEGPPPKQLPPGDPDAA